MPWIKAPVGGGGNGFDGEAFFVRKVVRRKPNLASGNRPDGKATRRRANRAADAGNGRPRCTCASKYIFEARIVRRSGLYEIALLKWPRSEDPAIHLDGFRTNLLNDTIIWIARDYAPRTPGDAVAWFSKWAECLVDYYETGAPFGFPRDPDL
jgi:hypothetical protein